MRASLGDVRETHGYPWTGLRERPGPIDENVDAVTGAGRSGKSERAPIVAASRVAVAASARIEGASGSAVDLVPAVGPT